MASDRQGLMEAAGFLLLTGGQQGRRRTRLAIGLEPLEKILSECGRPLAGYIADR